VSAAAASAATGLLTEDDVQYLWAPLSHSFGKALLVTQLVVGFSSAVCGDPARLAEGMAQVRPTFVAGPPRLYQRVHARARADLEAAGPVRRRLTRWAFDVGGRAAARRRGHRLPPSSWPALAVADQLALRDVRERFGGRVRYLLCGAAPLGEDVAAWFSAAGVEVLAGYGLTETTTVVALPRPDGLCPGAVGRPLAGTEVRLTSAGRVQVRGPGVTSGYQDRASDSAEALAADGWFSTGDCGRLVDGRLRITGRAQDVITTSTGARVAPQDLQERLTALCPYASHVVVVGEGRPWLGALVTLDADAVATWASSHGLAGRPYEEVVRSEQARAMVAERLAVLNADLEPGQRIERFAVLPRDLTVADGELTAALVPRRAVVERRWGATLDAALDAAHDAAHDTAHDAAPDGRLDDRSP
jgi:long-chain acyl-CoA synthetase